MRTIIYPLLLALIILLTSTLPIQVHAATTVTYTPGVKPGNSWTYSAFACVGSGCPSVGIASVNATVQSVTGNTVVASFAIVYSNGTVVMQHLQTDVRTGIGNGSILIIAGGLVAGNPINTQPFTPRINATLTKTYAGASRDVNMIESSNPFGGIFSILWDQRTGILVEALIGMPKTPFSQGLAEHLVLQSTNIWSAENSPHFSLGTTDFLLTGMAGMTARTTLTVTSADSSKSISLTATSFPLGPSVAFSPPTLTPVRDSSVTSTLTVTARGSPGFHLIAVTGADITGARTDATFLLLNVTSS